MIFMNEHTLVWIRDSTYVHSGAFMPVCARLRMCVEPTFLTVVLVLVQYKAMAALAHVGAHGVDALVLAAAVVLAALVFVCEGHTCNASLMRKRQRDGMVERERKKRRQ